MRLVDRGYKADHYHGHPVIHLGKHPGFLYFKDEAAVRGFMPEVHATFPRGPGYVAVCKLGMRMVPDEYWARLLRDTEARVLFTDIYDGSIVRPHLLEHCCERHVYLKANLSRRSLGGTSVDVAQQTYNLWVFPQFPVPRVHYAWLANPPPVPKDGPRELDVFFIGNMNAAEPKRRYRHRRVNELREACKRLGLRFRISNAALRPRGYLRGMGRALLCYSPPGSGFRCRREWEVMAAGSGLLLDAINEREQVQIADFRAEDHYCTLDRNIVPCLERLLSAPEGLVEMARRGYLHFRRAFVDHELSLTERWVRMYLLNTRAALTSLDDLEALERSFELS
jgi:hypothetical protein